MKLDIAHEAGYVLARTSGQLDESAVDLFREQLHPLVRQRGAKVILDVSGSQLITSSGLGQLVMLAANANTSGSRVVLAAVSSYVSIVLARCKLDKFFETAPTVAEAIQLLADQSPPDGS